MTKSQEYGVIISQKIAELFDDDSSFTIDLDELKQGENLNHFFLGFLKSSMFYLHHFSGKELDILEVSHVMNRLAVQDIIENGGFTGEEVTL